ncbi:uncharacterized protein LOC135372361 [Ornithodoros turicata]|uniref:uncharacterized protein LOC135372361 n=1 Tax=Ornithodoros turicata TaxID=34597 RepID=UPI0031393FAF
MASRKGGLGVLQLAFVAVQVQLKSLARLLRLGNPFVDIIFNTILNDHMQKLCQYINITVGITGARELNDTLKAAHERWFSKIKDTYKIRSNFAHENDPFANRWLIEDSRLLKDGDRIRALRLRTGIYPCRALSNKHAPDPADRLCHHCRQGEETPAHILQFRERFHGPRIERHKYLCDQMARLITQYNPHPGKNLEWDHFEVDYRTGTTWNVEPFNGWDQLKVKPVSRWYHL